MLEKDTEFIDKIDPLRNSNSNIKSTNSKASESIVDSVKIIMERLLTKSSEHPFSQEKNFY
jgi:hypothetical protein